MSIFLGIATIVSWIWSIHRLELLIVGIRDTHYDIYARIGNGGMALQLEYASPGANVGEVPTFMIFRMSNVPFYIHPSWDVPTNGRSVNLQRLGFQFMWWRLAQPRNYQLGVTFPCWFPLILFAVAPTMQVRRLVRLRNRRKSGLCLACGYDLRGIIGRCPECGSLIDQRGVSAS